MTNISELFSSVPFRVITKMTPALLLAWFLKTPESFLMFIWSLLSAYNYFPLLFLACYFIVGRKKKLKALFARLCKKQDCAKFERDHIKESLNLPTREHAQLILDTLEDNEVIVRGQKNKKVLNPLLGELEIKRSGETQETSHANSMQTVG